MAKIINADTSSSILSDVPDSMYMDTKVNVDKSSSFLKRVFGVTSFDKSVNPVYTTFKGGYGSYNLDMTDWDYFCLLGHLRICYDETDLIDGWKHISIHGYRYGYTYTPVKKLLWTFNHHIAFNKKWPFIKIGFHRIWPLYDKEKF